MRDFGSACKSLTLLLSSNYMIRNSEWISIEHCQKSWLSWISGKRRTHWLALISSNRQIVVQTGIFYVTTEKSDELVSVGYPGLNQNCDFCFDSFSLRRVAATSLSSMLMNVELSGSEVADAIWSLFYVDSMPPTNTLPNLFYGDGRLPCCKGNQLLPPLCYKRIY